MPREISGGLAETGINSGRKQDFVRLILTTAIKMSTTPTESLPQVVLFADEDEQVSVLDGFVRQRQ